MPGILYHLYFANVVCRKLRMLDNADFYIGNILPDSAVPKHDSHFWKSPDTDATGESLGFRAPNLNLAQKALAKVENESLRAGLYAHYYLDERFIKELLMAKFDWNTESHTVKNRYNRQRWTEKEFFSADGLYRGYGENNPILLENGLVSMQQIKRKIPVDLPMTGIPALDRRKPKNWLEELEGWLENPPRYTGDIFAYSELTTLVEKCAQDFKI